MDIQNFNFDQNLKRKSRKERSPHIKINMAPNLLKAHVNNEKSPK